MERVPVLIVGGGPVGLATALELARYGIRALLVERHETTTQHPKTRNVNTRTMEIVRGWGRAVYEAIVAVNLPPGWTDQIVYTRTLAGEELGRMPTKGFAGPGRNVSPEVPVLSSQDILEPILRRGAEATGLAELRFGHEAGRIERGAAADDDRVVISTTERATGRTYQVEADYLVAADGAASPVRAQLGIEMEGPRGIGHFVNPGGNQRVRQERRPEEPVEWQPHVASCLCLQCSYMRLTTAKANAVDQPTSKSPARPSIPASTRQPGPSTTSPKPIVV
jgi:putative polyketide hydroxylase